MTDAVRALAEQDIEAVSLDYDIEIVEERGKFAFPIYDRDNKPVNTREKFEAVAYYIAALVEASHFDWKPHVRIHTASDEGASRMAKILEDVGVKVDIRMATQDDSGRILNL